MNMHLEDEFSALDLEIELWFDGELNAVDALDLERRAASDSLIRDKIEISRAMRGAFQAMSVPVCPDYVTKNVRSAVRGQFQREMFHRLMRIRDHIRRRLLAPVAITAVLIALVFGASLFRMGQPEPEVAAALSDVKRTLAYLSGVNENTGSRLRTEALEPVFDGPVRRALGTFIQD